MEWKRRTSGFDPLFLVVKGMQDKQMQVLECIKMFSDMGLNSTGGLSNNSNGMPKHIRPLWILLW